MANVSVGTSVGGRRQVDKTRRPVVEIQADLHQRIRQLALLNGLRTCVLVNAVIEEALEDEEHVKSLNKRLRL